MSRTPYTFNKIIDREQAELIIAMFHEQQINYKCELEVYAAICEILYQNGFRAFVDGMHNQVTDYHFDWDKLSEYKTVVDFQIDWASCK